MQYRIAAHVQAMLSMAVDRLSDQRGQGTVEYVGVVVMVTLLVAAMGVLASKWAAPVGKELREALQDSINHATKGITQS
jgi:uncharacterized membrane-anchored protein